MGFFSQQVWARAYFFLKRFVWEPDFLFYGELPVHMECRRSKGSRQMREGIKVTAGECVLQGITDYKIFSLKTKLNRRL